MNGEQDILIACNVGDLFWLKRSLPGREKLINKIVNNEVNGSEKDNHVESFYDRVSHLFI